LLHVISPRVFVLMSTLNYYNTVAPATASLLSSTTGLFAKGCYAGPSLAAVAELSWIYYTLLRKQILQMSPGILFIPLISLSFTNNLLFRDGYTQKTSGALQVQRKTLPAPRENTSFHRHPPKGRLGPIQGGAYSPSFTFKLFRNVAAWARFPLM